MNGKAERVNLTLFNKVGAMLLKSNKNKKMWGFAVLTAAYLLNRSASSAMETTPAEKWYGRKPNISNIREFGQIIYTKNLGYLRKLDDRSQKEILVSYAPNGYRKSVCIKRHKIHK